MAGAQIESLETIKNLRVALLKFCETGRVALADAEGELSRTLVWLETEQQNFWKSQIVKSQGLVARAKEQLRMKQLFKDPSGRPQSAVDEQKQLANAQRRLTECEQKLQLTMQSARRLSREAIMFKGQIQRLGSAVTVEVPNAANRLGQMIQQIERYASGGATVNEGGLNAGAGPGMTRPAVGALQLDPAVLRARTPDAERRSAAGPGDVTLLPPWAGLSDAGREMLGKIELPREEPPAGGTITAARDAFEGAFYLQRTAATSSSDTGWHIGPADAREPGEPQTFQLAELVARSADWPLLLALPLGSLAAIEAQRLVRVWDAQDQSLPPT